MVYASSDLCLDFSYEPTSEISELIFGITLYYKQGPRHGTFFKSWGRAIGDEEHTKIP